MVILRLYLFLVRPHLEYASQVWSPYTSKDIQVLEKVQKFALRMCAKNYQSEYAELLELFDIPSLEIRRLFCHSVLYTVLLMTYIIFLHAPFHLLFHLIALGNVNVARG